MQEVLQAEEESASTEQQAAGDAPDGETVE
jgi:hypothetical protein